MKDEEIIEMIEKAEKDKIWKSYLFNQLPSVEKPELWLEKIKEKGFFDPKYNIPPQKDEKGYRIPYWNVLNYLKIVSEKNRKIGKNEYTNTLIEIINSIILYKGIEERRVENPQTDRIMIILIFNLSTDKISDKHLDYVKQVLHSEYAETFLAADIVKTIFPDMLNRKEKKVILKLIELILDYKKDKKSYFSKYVSVLGDYWFNQLLSSNKEAIFSICGMKLYPVIMTKIESILNEKGKDKSSFVITIEDSPQNLTDNYFSQLISFLRDLLIFAGPKLIEPRIRTLLSKETSIFKRLSVYLIGYYYDDLNEIFWELEENPLEFPLIKHELFYLFEKNCSKFTKDQINKTIQWIQKEDTTKYSKLYEDKDERGKAIAYHRKEWLLSLKDTNDEKVNELFEKYDKIYPIKVEHPGHLIWSSPVTVSEIGETDKFDKLVSDSNQSIAQFLINQEVSEKEEGDRRELSYENLTWLVQKNPKKFSTNLEPFPQISRGFQHAILAGLCNAWRSGKDFEWSELLDFGLKIVKQENFWIDDYGKSINYRELITKKLADLIDVGTKDDNHAFPEKYLTLAEQILITLATNDKSELEFSRDLITSVINSPKGSIFSAMMHLSLRKSRLAKKAIWPEDLKGYFENIIINKLTPSKELFVITGLYLNNLLYLNRKWVETNINNIFPKENEEYWKSAFIGYLFSASRLYSDVYKLLKENGHYHKALDTEFDNEASSNRIGEHISVAYLNNLEHLDDPNGLFNLIFSKRKLKQILSIVRFIRRLGDKVSEAQKKMIIPLWENIVKNIQGEESEDASTIFSNLFHWIMFIGKIDDQTGNLLIMSAGHVKKEYEKQTIIESLLKHVENTPSEVGQIFLEIIKEGTLPFYKEENIRKIVTVLYENNEEKVANEICRKYWNQEMFLLQDLYNQYNP